MTAPQPRLLYSATFTWLAVTGGRFMAPFLEHQANFSDSLVGTALASQYAVYSLLGSAGGSWADSRESRYPNRGRAQVMFAGAALGSTAFLLHGTSLVFPTRQTFSSTEWHFALRILWACSLALVMPVLDGMTLAHLEKTNGMDPSDYGKERLYGAISWAVVNLMIGPIVDRFGFVALYPFAMIVTVVFFVSIAIYVKGQESAESITQEEINNSSTTIETLDDLIHDKIHDSHVSMLSLVRILAGTIYGVCFLLAVVCLSSGMSVVESLVFLFFEFLGGSNTMCGITVALTVLFEIPIFHVAPKLLQKLGSGRLLLLAGGSYIIRVIGYSVIPKGHVVTILLLEPLHGVTYACAQTSTVDFAAHLTPKGSEASGQGLMGVVKGVGSVTGLFLGGLFEQTFGPRFMYRIFASTVSVGMTVLSISTCLCRDSPTSTRHQALPQFETEFTSVLTTSDETEETCCSNEKAAVVEFI